MSTPFGSNPVIAVGADPRGESSADIDLGSFWPKVSPADFRLAMKLDGSVTEERIRVALIDATVTVIEGLSEWKIAQLESGVTELTRIGLQIDGKGQHVHRFTRAVHCLAAASIAERYRGTDATGAGNQKADLIESPIEDLRRDAFWAMADIRGTQRTVVELI